jgi:hypothetical protein
MDMEMNGRRLDLDWLRIAAFGLLILYHVGMFYVPWDWHIKTDDPVPWLEPVMATVNPWRLTLLFFVSGAATRFMLRKWSPWRLLRERAPRLLLPLAFGMLVVVPPQTYVQLDWHTPAPDVMSFYRSYVTGSGGWTVHGATLQTPTWNHLWFVAYLLAYTVGLGLLLTVAPRAALALGRVADRAGAHPWTLAFPAAWFVGVQLLVAPSYPETHAFVGDWTVHAESLAAYLLGFAAAASGTVWTTLAANCRRWAIVAGLALGTYVATLALLVAGLIGNDAARPVLRIGYGSSQWLCTIAALALAARHLAHRDHAARRYLTEAIFPFYILHQTLIILVAKTLRPLHLPAGIEAAVLIAATAGGCLIGFEIIRRVGPLRPLFGLNPREMSRPRTIFGMQRFISSR